MKLDLLKKYFLFTSAYIFDKRFCEIKEKLKEYEKDGIVIYGLGGHTQVLLKYLEDENIEVYGLIDRGNNIGKNIFGYNVYGIDDIKNKVKNIIISSQSYQEIIYKRINYLEKEGNNIIKLYKEEDFELLNVILTENDDVIVNKYLNENCNFLGEEELEKHYKKLDEIDKPIIDSFIENFYSEKNEMDLFYKIEIETVNRCNNSCSFCPVNRNLDTREYKEMDEKLFNKIIDELNKLNYNGKICLFSNNEPLLDRRIFEFNEIARKKLPNAFLYLYTNGTLLTIEKFEKLINNLDLLIIDNYSDSLELIKPVREIYEYCKKNNKYLNKIQIHLRKQNEFLTSRGGQANNRNEIQTLESSCVLPFIQLIVRPDGKVSLCCNDALGKYTLGDLNKQGLQEIWNGEIYKDIRNKIASGRCNLDLCKGCDTLIMP